MSLTTYKLKKFNVDLNDYIEKCVFFLVEQINEKVDHFAQIFQITQLYNYVNYSQNDFYNFDCSF